MKLVGVECIECSHYEVSFMNVECFIKLILILSNMIYFTIQILEGVHYHPSLDYSYVLNYFSYLNHSHVHIL
jgi:hypothetical protein